MHPNDENLLIVGTIEGGDPSAFGKPVRRAPEKIMFQFLGAWLFAGGVYPLKRPTATHSGWMHSEVVAVNSTLQLVFPGVLDTASSTCKRASQWLASL